MDRLVLSIVLGKNQGNHPTKKYSTNGGVLGKYAFFGISTIGSC